MAVARDPEKVFVTPAERFVVTEDRTTGSAGASAPRTVARPLRCVVAGGSLVGLSAAIALSPAAYLAHATRRTA
jgi:hypothetical protein